MSADEQRPVEATEYHFGGVGEWPTINGERVPWLVSLDEGRGIYPMVQSLGYDNALHVLWLPILVGAPMPTPPEGHPDGEPVDLGEPS